MLTLFFPPSLCSSNSVSPSLRIGSEIKCLYENEVVTLVKMTGMLCVQDLPFLSLFIVTLEEPHHTLSYILLLSSITCVEGHIHIYMYVGSTLHANVLITQSVHQNYNILIS